MRLLVTGCGRSGTTWLAAALRTTGIDCGYERAFTPGFDGWPPRWGKGRWSAEVSTFAAPFTSGFRSDPAVYVVRLVRDPRRVVGSMLARSPGQLASTPQAEQFYRLHVSIDYRDPVLLAGSFWVAWNRLVMADETLRFEDVDPETVTRLSRIVDKSAAIADPPKTAINAAHRPVPDVTFGDLARVPGLVDLAREFGYITDS